MSVPIQDPRKNASDLLDRLKQNWNIPAQPRDLSWPKDGMSPTAVTFVGPHYVVKSLRPTTDSGRAAWGRDVFDREHTVLHAVTSALADDKNRLGVHVPTLVAPTKVHDNDIFVMTRVPGEPLKDHPALLTDDMIAEKLAHFFVGFDNAMAQQQATTTDTSLFKTRPPPEIPSLPDEFAPIRPHLRHADTLMGETSDAKPRFMHDDFNLGNILVHQNQTQNQTPDVGVIDFGEVAHGDPHHGMAKFLMFVESQEGGPTLFKNIITHVNRISANRGDPWNLDIARCIQLMPAMAVKRTMRNLNYGKEAGQPYTPTEKAEMTRLATNIDTLTTRFAIRHASP